MTELSTIAESSAIFSRIQSPPEPVHFVPSPILLRKLRIGQRAIVVSLNGNAHEVARLSEMGLRRGVEVTVLRNGITCILQLEGHRLCIRLSKDLSILVSPV